MKNNLQILLKEDQNKKFFDLVARYYDKGIVGNWLFSVIEKTINSVNIKKSSKILDVGTGTGNLIYLLEKQNKKLNLYGIDISKKMLTIARKKVKTAKFIKISVLLLEKEFPSKFFDYIFVIDAFHHFPYQKNVMNNFYNILKINGRLVITELDFGFIFNYFFHIIEPGNEWLYTKKELKNLFLVSGFLIEKQKKIGTFAVMTLGVKYKNSKSIENKHFRR